MDTTRNLDVVDRKIETHYWQQTQWFNVVDSTDLFDSSNGHDPKPGCCQSENRNSLLTTYPAVQSCQFDRFVRFVEWTRPETLMLSIGKSKLVTDNRPGGSTLSIRPIHSIHWMDTNRNGFCWAENRISLLTTDPGVVQGCRFDRFVRFVKWTRPETWMLLIRKSHLITDNRPSGSTLSIGLIRSIRRMDTTRNVTVVNRKLASH